jgi:hypothetical protein
MGGQDSAGWGETERVSQERPFVGAATNLGNAVTRHVSRLAVLVPAGGGETLSLQAKPL